MEIELQNQNPQIPQPQNPQFQQQSINQPLPNQFQPMPNIAPQIIHQQIPPNFCEKFSACLTGTRNIPLTVFFILMACGLNFIVSLLTLNLLFNYSGSFLWSSLGLLLFSVFVWAPMAIKIEKASSTVRYGCLFFINYSILSLVSFSFPLLPTKIWCFVLFETLLISLENKDKKLKFFCCKISGRKMIFLVCVYTLIFNWAFFFSFLMTVIYTFIYKKCLMKKFVISNERVERIENCCLFSCFKNTFQTFITLQESMTRLQAKNKQIQQIRPNQPNQQIQQQPQQFSNFSMNSSGGTFYAYPAYYFSGAQVPQAHPLPQVVPPPSQPESGQTLPQRVPDNNANINMQGEASMNSSYRNLNGSSYMSLAPEVNNQA